MRRQYLSSWRIRSGKQDGAHSAERCNRERQPPRSHHLIQPSQQRHRGKCTFISPSPYSSFLHSSLDIQNVKSLFTAERESYTCRGPEDVTEARNGVRQEFQFLTRLPPLLPSAAKAAAAACPCDHVLASSDPADL